MRKKKGKRLSQCTLSGIKSDQNINHSYADLCQHVRRFGQMTSFGIYA